MSRIKEMAIASRCLKTARLAAGFAWAAAVLCAPAHGQETYHYYFGNTHAHTVCSDGKETATDHYRKAKAAGFDFYAVTDHALAKHANFTPQSYADTRRAANECTDATFVAIAGFEFSENDRPGGKGHLNALNTAGYLDATGPEVNLPVFYDWLVKNRTPATAASFNHPGSRTHNGYDYLNPERRDEITMFEVINSGKLLYAGFLVALNKGWRVAPIAGNDDHGTWRLTHHRYRTGVLATSLTRDSIMQAMRSRRVYCTWDTNLKLSLKVNDQMMGSVLRNPSSLTFSVDVSDPDIGEANERITKIEIIGDDGVLVGSKDFSEHSVSWNVTYAPQYGYYFVNVYTADKADGPGAYLKEVQARASSRGKKRGPAAGAKASSTTLPATSPDTTEGATAYSAPVWID